MYRLKSSLIPHIVSAFVYYKVDKVVPASINGYLVSLNGFIRVFPCKNGLEICKILIVNTHMYPNKKK